MLKIDKLYTVEEQEQLSESIRTDYIDNNMMLKDVLVKYGITEAMFAILRKRYDLYKPKDLKRKSWENAMENKYGVKCAFQTESVKQQRHDTMMRRYGTTHALQVPEFADKAKETTRERYGVDYAMQSAEIADKVKQANLAKFGYTTNLVTPQHRHHTSQLMQQRYGVDNYVESDEHKKYMQANREAIEVKRERTCLDRYGSTSFLTSDIGKSVYKQRMQELYGVATPLASAEIAKRRKNTIKERYGVDDYMMSMQFKARINSIYYDRSSCNYSFEAALSIVSDAAHFRNYFYQLKPEYRNYGYMIKDLCMCREVIQEAMRLADISSSEMSFVSRSIYENQIAHFLDDIGVKYVQNNPYIQADYVLDFYLPEYKLAIEFDGTYWHSENFHDKYYHRRKLMKLAEAGIRLYAVQERDWVDSTKRVIVESQLRGLVGKLNRVFARQCNIVELDSATAREFLSQNHLQGFVGASTYLGLVRNNQLLEVMSFGRNRFSSIDGVELYRLCTLRNTAVVGGASKLFKYYVKTYNPSVVISYADLSFGTGNVYTYLGFQLTQQFTDPGYVWVNPRTGEVVSRYSAQMANEDSIMHDRGFFRIYGYGSSRYEWYSLNIQ